MKKYMVCLFFSFCFFFLIIPNVYAEEYIILNTNKYFRSQPGGTLLTNVVTDGVLLNGSRVIVLDKNGGTGYGCVNPWYKVSYNGNEGYICSSSQVIQETVEVDLNGDFEQQMLSIGFKESYLPYLKALHEKHSNWTFTPLITHLDFEVAAENENIGDISVVDGDDGSLRAVDSSGNYIESDESGWYIASRSTVKYYMDPRNFLSEEYIFMFENLGYNQATQSREVIQSVVDGSFLNTEEYITLLERAARDYQVSPVYLASRIRQEKGTNGGIGTDGAAFHFAIDTQCLAKKGYSDSSSWNAKNDCGTDEWYEGIYNFYNIGAYSTYQSAVIRGLIWGKGGFDSSVTSYMRPWDTKEKAILGGASYITTKFISKGQHTLYLQRFNVSPNATYPNYTNQYMTNVRAHAQEAYKIFKSYRDNNLLNTNYEFLIPVYENMDSESGQIIPDNPKEEPEEIIVMDLGTIVTGAGYKLNNTIVSGIPFNKNKNTLQDELHSIYEQTQILDVKNKYGTSKDGNLGTGDVITLTNGKDTINYTAVIYGDNNGDGNVTILDLLRIQKHLLGNSNLSNIELTASDTNKDGNVNIVDLLRIQKHILGSITIEQ